jgi:hypothetical protein
MDTAKTLIRFVVAIALLLFICGLFGLVVFGARNISSQGELDQQLIELDKQFSVTRGQIPTDTKADVFLPVQIGNFQRDMGINNYIHCSSDDGFPKPCFSTSYYTDSKDYQSRVWVTILQKSIQQNSTLNDIFGPVTCGDMMANRALRTVSHIPYLYGTCPPGLFAPPELHQITWGNGNWFIQVNGQYDAISQFIAAYPY